MKISRYLIPTQKEDPSDAVVTSHKLMIRAALIKKETAGMYIYLPLGFRVLQKIIRIIREEMDNSGALEFLMPEMTSADLWKESGRWDAMGPEMIRITDRNGLQYALAPTHEESFTNAVRSIISSYRDLPVNVYQINTKFRDEIRPRFGVIRSKEFIMKDAYSFDMDEKGLEEAYQTMRSVYRKIFTRCGLKTIPVEADTGAMGGSNSEEFMVASEIGEDTLIICDACGYRANQEKAEFKREEVKNGSVTLEELKAVDTPDVKTIDDLVEFFSLPADKFLKSIIYTADGEPVMAVVPGSKDVNELKLKNFLKAALLELAPDSLVEDITKAPVGFAGPVNNFKIKTVLDISIKDIANAITGANEKDRHFTGVNPGRDFQVVLEADISTARSGDTCTKCGKTLTEKKGIEVGHIFKLGYKYTKSMQVSVLDINGKSVTPIMGCYGIGVNRTMAAIVEQNNDDKGIVWPISIAPFQVHMVGIAKSPEEIAAADRIYSMVKDAGYEIIFDDRKVSPGFKFADADLIGIPIRITVGKSFFTNGEIEVKRRDKGDIDKVREENLLDAIKKLVAQLSAEL